MGKDMAEIIIDRDQVECLVRTLSSMLVNEDYVSFRFWLYERSGATVVVISPTARLVEITLDPDKDEHMKDGNHNDRDLSPLTSDILDEMDGVKSMPLSELAELLGETMNVTKVAAKMADELEVVGGTRHVEQIVRWRK